MDDINNLGNGNVPTPRPTASDSLALYNNALAVLNWYRNNGYKQTDNERLTSKERNKVFGLIDDYNNFWNTTPEITLTTSHGLKKHKDVLYRKELGPNKFAQREAEIGIINTDAPAAVYDRRINPSMSTSFEKDLTSTIYKNSPSLPSNAKSIQKRPKYNNNIDAATVFTYDPLQVKPYKYLSDSEKKLREQLYGASVQRANIIKKLIKKMPPAITQQDTRTREDVEYLQPKEAAALSTMIDGASAPEVKALAQTLPAKSGSMGFALQYPMLKSALGKLAMRMKGEPMMPYWEDEYGNKRYPAFGENNPEQVRMNRLLTQDLDPSNPEDAAELIRINDLMKRKKNMEK